MRSSNIHTAILFALLCSAKLASNPAHAQFSDDTESGSGLEASGSGDGFPMPTPPSTMPTAISESLTVPQTSPTAVPNPSPYVMFGNLDKILRVNLDQSELILVANKSSILNHTTAIDYDIRRDFLFWSDVSFRKIIKAHLNGSEPQVIVDNGISVADGLAWDWLNEKLYWTDTKHNEIEVMDINTGHRAQLIHTGEGSRPRGIVLDPNNRCLYWTDWGQQPRIERASMDGTNRQILHSTGLRWPNGITMDYHTQTLYWIDAYLDKLESSFANGSGRHLLTNSLIINIHPFSLSFFEDTLYWSDWKVRQVISAQTATPDLFSVLVPTLKKPPTTVKVVALEAQPISSANPCGSDNGGCSHLCLLSNSRNVGYSCFCPTGLELDENGTTCLNVTEAPTTETAPEEGSCIAAGYLRCCEDGEAQCLGSPATCSCHASCNVTGDCCKDIDQLDCNYGTTTDEPLTTPLPTTSEPATTLPPAPTYPYGSCREAGYFDCCVKDHEEGVYCVSAFVDCYCDAECILFDDCCEDFEDICKLDSIASTTFVPEVSTTVSVPPSSSQSPMATETPQASSVINTYVPTTTQLISTTAHFHTSEPASSSTHTGVETTVMATADVTASTSLPSQNSATLSDSVMVTRTVDQTILVTPSASAASASARPTSSAALTQTHSPLSETLDQSSVLVSPTHTLDQASVLVSPTESDTFDQTIVVKPTSTDTVPPTVQHVHTQVSSTSSVDDHSWSADLSPSPSVLVHTSASGVQSSAMTSNNQSSSTPGSSSAENIMASIGAQVAHSPTLSTKEGDDDSGRPEGSVFFIGPIIFVLAIIVSLLIVGAFIFIVIRKKKRTSAIVTYEIFENQNASLKDVKGVVELSKKPSFTENSSTDSGVNFKIDSTV